MALDPNKVYSANIQVQSVGNDPRFQVNVNYSEELGNEFGTDEDNTPESFKVISSLVMSLMKTAMLSLDGPSDVDKVFDDLPADDDEEQDGVVVPLFPTKGS